MGVCACRGRLSWVCVYMQGEAIMGVYLICIIIFYRVQEQSKKNRMDATNLAVVFAPSIMRSPYGSGIQAVQKLPEQKKVIELLISQCTNFFS